MNLQDIQGLMTGDYRLSLGDQVLPILYGIILLIVAHFVGQFLKQVVIKGMHRLRIDHHINNLTKGNVAVDLTQPLGKLVYYVTLLFFLPAIFQQFGLTSMLEPIQAMIQDITGYIPNLLSAGIIGAIFYIFSTVARDLISSLTAGFGVDQIVEKMDLKGITLQPSYLLGTIVFWIIAVTGIAEVANALNLNVLQDTVYNILGIAGNVLLGVAILMLGVYAAKTVRQIAVSSGASKAVGQLAYLAILIFIGAIGLQQMNLGTDIVNMTFAFLLGALALGVAIAIGLGAKDSIGKLVDDVITSFK